MASQPWRKTLSVAWTPLHTRLCSSAAAGTDVLAAERTAEAENPGAEAEGSTDSSVDSSAIAGSNFDDFIMGPPVPISEPMAVIVGGGPCGALLVCTHADRASSAA